MERDIKTMEFDAMCNFVLFGQCAPRYQVVAGKAPESKPGAPTEYSIWDNRSGTYYRTDGETVPIFVSEADAKAAIIGLTAPLDLTGMRQLRGMWTAYCIHNNLDPDTLEYDTELLRLWNETGLERVGSGPQRRQYEAYYFFMGENLC